MTLVLAALLGLFAIANPHGVMVSLWPLALDAEVPLWLAVLGPAALAFALGAAVVWGAHWRQRRRLATLEQAARLMEAELASREETRKA
ncbi:lipopolysaccharide assembly protein LapA domain-containing protein [Roseococcus sp. DSY-14]|uniref:lipopolysaccharide assembly protein LapA domain-containing protein n=1 Tax=Roseococcus sp. DSY-14 TaxID=3369650 RepID=UPI00387AF5AD